MDPFLDDDVFEVGDALDEGADHPQHDDDILMLDSDPEVHPGDVLWGLDTDEEEEEREGGERDGDVIQHNYR
jgi:hypothetical protein